MEGIEELEGLILEELDILSYNDCELERVIKNKLVEKELPRGVVLIPIYSSFEESNVGEETIIS